SRVLFKGCAKKLRAETGRALESTHVPGELFFAKDWRRSPCARATSSQTRRSSSFEEARGMRTSRVTMEHTSRRYCSAQPASCETLCPKGHGSERRRQSPGSAEPHSRSR